MGENSKIEWTDHTFNPWMGCTKVSEACKFCYAESFTNHYKLAQWGDQNARMRTVATNWKKPFKWNREAYDNKTRKKVFCASLADIFDDHESILPEWRAKLWKMIKLTTNLDWLLLTKRPENIVKFLPEDWGDGYPNVWLGISVENQERANERIPILSQIPAKIRFMSCEPLLGEIRFNVPNLMFGSEYGFMPYVHNFHWCIIGGESGPVDKIRKLNPKDCEKLINDCDIHIIKVFFKQLGTVLAKYTNQQHVKGADFAEYPNEFKSLMRREFPV